VQSWRWTQPHTTTNGIQGTARRRGRLQRAGLRRLTFELKPTTEAGGVRLDCDVA
jgi:molybdenum cofactor biosynthesis enzyme MoaA